MEVKNDSNKPPFNAPEVKLHFLDYWRIIRVRKTVILAVFLLVTITTTVVTFIHPKTYASTVRIKVEKNATDVDPLGGRQAVQAYDPYWVTTEFQTIQSKSILHPVVTNLNLQNKWAEDYKVDELTLELAYKVLKGNISLDQARNTSLIEIRAFSKDPYEAATIANEIAETYKESRLADQREIAERGIKTLEKELAEQNEKAQEQQTVVDDLKIKLQISEFEAQGINAGTPEPQLLLQVERQRIEAQAEFHHINALYGYLTNLSRAEFKKAVATAKPDMQLVALLDSLHAAEQRFALLAVHYAPEFPDVKALLSTIAVIERQVDDRLEGILLGLKALRNAQEEKLKVLEAEVKEFREFDIQTAVDRRPYWEAKRKLENYLYIRDRLLLQIQQEAVNAAIPTSSIVKIIDKAEPEWRPVKPRKALNITLGVIVGLAIGVGLAFFIEYLDTSVKTIDDVERALQAPVLGVIPQNVGSLLEEGPDSPHAEAYRVLRTNILFSQKDPHLNSMTVVSAGAGEGKSTTIFNLAAIFAQNGHRVLLVDSDLRRPSIHKFLKVTNSVGLTNFLLKQNTLEEVIQTTSVPSLDFMPSGKLPSSSMGILSSAQMKELIRDLKRRYDYVFFDSPPIMGVSDASILASEVDMVLQVIQYRRYPQPMTIRAKQMIEKVGGNLLGIVLNNINMSSDENYYYYSGYYYDYYSKEDDNEVKTPGGAPEGREEAKVEIRPKY